MFPRLVIVYIGLFICTSLIYVIKFTSKKGEPITGWKSDAIKWLCMCSSRVTMFCVGVTNVKVEKVKVDYSKYLGPDWKEDVNAKPGSVVCNHQSWVDIKMNMYRQAPSHIAKMDTLKIPIIGSLATATGCLFVERDSAE